MNVLQRVASLRHLSSAFLDQFGSKLIATQTLLDRPRAKRFFAQAGHADADIFTANLLTDSKPDGHTNNGEAGSLLSHFEVGTSAAPRRDRHPDLRQDLSGLDRCNHGTKKKFRGGNLSLSFWPQEFQLPSQSEDRRRPISRGIGVRQAATDGTAIAHLDIAD